MIKVTEEAIKCMELNYPGITEEIQRFENMELPPCPGCGSADTASVQVGIIGRTIHLSGTTTKFHLIPNNNSEGIYFCNVCKKQFGPNSNVRTKPIFSRPRDDSWQAFRDWVLSLTSALTGKEAEDSQSEAYWKRRASEFWSKSPHGGH